MSRTFNPFFSILSLIGILHLAPLSNISLLVSASSERYTTRTSTSWPTTGDWLKLYQSLSETAELFGPFQPSDYEDQCGVEEIDPFDPFIVAMAGEGICMQYPSCANLFCLEGDERNDLPAFSLMAKTELDVIRGIQFANKHRLQVTVKTSGHSAIGASTATDSLMIWLAHFPQDNTIRKYSDSCNDGIEHDVIGVNAGQNFHSMANAIQDDYHFVSASEQTVGASGGWILGNGLSFTSRHYGLGIDNVIDFRVVLPSGAMAVADRCTNSDLFWALRGGGGGTFGVVTHMNYKLHPQIPIVRVQFSLGDRQKNSTDVKKFVKFWVEQSTILDTRWGGRFSGYDVDLFFAGNLIGAKASFLDDFDTWVRSDLDPESILPLPSNTTKVYSSWSAVLPQISSDLDGTGTQYITESTFSRIIPEEYVTKQRQSAISLIESLIISDSLGYTNFFLGGKINEIPDTDTSVHPAMRESSFLITANQYGYAKLLEKLPNDVTGVSKNHHGGLEPEWRQSIWGEHYPRLLTLKNQFDPIRLFNCYMSVGYEGPEVSYFNVDVYLATPPTSAPLGTLDATSSASHMSLMGSKIVIGLTAAVTAFLGYLW